MLHSDNNTAAACIVGCARWRVVEPHNKDTVSVVSDIEILDSRKDKDRAAVVVAPRLDVRVC